MNGATLFPVQINTIPVFLVSQYAFTIVIFGLILRFIIAQLRMQIDSIPLTAGMTITTRNPFGFNVN
jgi:hypothetical protein